MISTKISTSSVLASMTIAPRMTSSGSLMKRVTFPVSDNFGDKTFADAEVLCALPGSRGARCDVAGSFVPYVSVYRSVRLIRRPVAGI